MSCSRQRSAIVFGPRNDASTISVFSLAVNFRYVRISLNDCSYGLSGPSSERHPGQAAGFARHIDVD
jgi:hypothetical protein